MTNRYKYIEPFLEDRVESAKKYAERIANGEIETEEDLELLFRTVISEYYKIPMFHGYFSDRTLDELAFEAHFIRSRGTPIEEKAHDLIADNLQEAAAAAEEAWKDIDSIVPSKDELERMAKFMNDGKFDGE